MEPHLYVEVDIYVVGLKTELTLRIKLETNDVEVEYQLFATSIDDVLLTDFLDSCLEQCLVHSIDSHFQSLIHFRDYDFDDVNTDSFFS